MNLIGRGDFEGRGGGGGVSHNHYVMKCSTWIEAVKSENLTTLMSFRIQSCVTVLRRKTFSGVRANSIVMQVFFFNADSSIFLEQISRGTKLSLQLVSQCWKKNSDEKEQVLE